MNGINVPGAAEYFRLPYGENAHIVEMVFPDE